MRCFFLSPRRFGSGVRTSRFLRCRRICRSEFCNALGSRMRGRLTGNRSIVFSMSMGNNIGVGGFCNRHTLDVFIRPPSMRRLHHHLMNHGASTPRMVRRHLTGTDCRLAFTPRFSRMIMGSSLRGTRRRICRLIGTFLNTR